MTYKPYYYMTSELFVEYFESWFIVKENGSGSIRLYKLNLTRVDYCALKFRKFTLTLCA